jgi:lipopolysaccharide export LptBFGC system permease protein LptF
LTIERYILRQLLTGFVFSAGGMLFVAIPGILVGAIQKLGGVGIQALMGFLPLVIVELVPYLVPIALLLTIVSTYGRLAADNEWTAMVMAGVHPLRMLLPGALLAVGLALPLQWVMTDVAPGLNFAKNNYAKTSVMRALRTMSPGKTELRFKDFYMSARSRDAQNRNRFEQVFMHLPETRDAAAQTLLAKTAEFSFDADEMVVELTAPRWISGPQDARVGNARLRAPLDALFPTDVSRRVAWKYQRSGELAERVERTLDKLETDGKQALDSTTEEQGYIPAKDLNAARFEVHSRNTVAASCVMFLLLGVATGLTLRSGAQLGALATGVGYALAYYLLSMRFGKGLALHGSVPQWLAAWAVTMVGTIVGLVLCWRALRR